MPVNVRELRTFIQKRRLLSQGFAECGCSNGGWVLELMPYTNSMQTICSYILLYSVYNTIIIIDMFFIICFGIHVHVKKFCTTNRQSCGEGRGIGTRDYNMTNILYLFLV
jgi:hypothetical protein